jgi:hypothetical protein
MKRNTMVILFGIVVFFPLVCAAAYVIHLKDGRSVTTSEYREEGDQIKFKRFGGVIGIPKDQVKEIEEIEDFPEEKVVANPETPSATEKTEVSEGAAKADEEADKIGAFLGEKRRLIGEMEWVNSEFKEAKSKGDKKTQQELLTKLISLRDKITELKHKVEAAFGGKLPEWWNETR